jgi:hypothetical protein
MSFSVADISLSFKTTPVTEVDPAHLRTATKTTTAATETKDTKPLPQPTQAEQAAKLASQGQTVYQIAAALGISITQADLALDIQQVAVKSQQADTQTERISLEA